MKEQDFIVANIMVQKFVIRVQGN